MPIKSVPNFGYCVLVIKIGLEKLKKWTFFNIKPSVHLTFKLLTYFLEKILIRKVEVLI